MPHNADVVENRMSCQLQRTPSLVLVLYVLFLLRMPLKETVVKQLLFVET